MKSMFLTMFQKAVPLVCAVALTACGGGAKKTTTAEIPAQPAFAKTDLAVGTGEIVAAGDLATVNYTGYFYDSSKPNSRGAQFETGSRSFAAGTGAMLPGTAYTLLGWDQGVPGMKVGGKANLVMPYNLAYGLVEYTSAQGTKVPVYTPVVFEVEVVSVKKASPSVGVEVVDKVVGTGALVEYNKTLTYKYTAWLYDAGKPAAEFKGTQYATDTTGNYTYVLGSGIKGLDRGLIGMKVGGQRKLIIQPQVGYGSVGLTSTDSSGVKTTLVPPDAVLIYEIELLGVK